VDPRDLYHRPLEEFIARRTELARELRSAGDREGAAAVAALRKPSLSAWVINQLAGRPRGIVIELLASASDVLEAQRMSGASAGEVLRDALARFRAALDEVGREAGAVLEESGHPVSDTVVRRAQTSAQAGAVGDAAMREALFLGTLDRDVDPPGFAAAAEEEPDRPAVATAIADRRRVRATEGRSRVSASAARRRAAEVEARRAEQEAIEQRREAVRLAEAAVRGRQRADRLAEDAKGAAGEAAEAERLAEAAQQAARQAEARADELRSTVGADQRSSEAG
jgi:hypothetical protein